MTQDNSVVTMQHVTLSQNVAIGNEMSNGTAGNLLVHIGSLIFFFF